MIAGDVVGREVEDEAHAALGQLGARHAQTVVAAQGGVGAVAAHGIGRADHVFGRPVGQDGVELLAALRVIQIDLGTEGAALPDAHQPDGVEAEISQLIPGSSGHIGQGDRPAILAAQFAQPEPGIDLVDDWTGGQGNTCPALHLA